MLIADKIGEISQALAPMSFLERGKAASIGVVFLLVLNGCSENSGEHDVCYSVISLSAALEQFEHPFDHGLREVHESLWNEYNDGAMLAAIPIAQEGKIYIASNCEYRKKLSADFGSLVKITKSTEEEYFDRHEVAGSSRKLKNFGVD